MKKIIAATIVVLLGVSSMSAMACPKGEYPYGGSGPHHKGGYCA